MWGRREDRHLLYFLEGQVHLQTCTDSILCIFSNLQVKGETTKIISLHYFYHKLLFPVKDKNGSC